MSAKEQSMVVGNGCITIAEVAAKLRVSRSWVYKKAKAGIIPHIRIGNMMRFFGKDIDAWVAGHKVKGCLKT